MNYLSRSHSFAGDEQLRIDVVEVPFERLALEVAPQLDSAADVAEVAEVVPDAVVVVLFVVIQPDLGQADRIPSQDVDSGTPFVRRAFSENVAHMRTRDNFQTAAAHPSLKEGKSDACFFSHPNVASFEYICTKSYYVMLRSV